MKRILTLSVLIASAALFTFGQTVDGQSAHGKVEQQIIALHREFADAMLRRDTTTLERILADEFLSMDTANRGEGITKRLVIDSYKANPNPPAGSAGRWNSFDIADSVVSVHGNTAVLTSREVVKGVTPNGQGFTSNSLVTTVFTKRQGGWRIIATHGRRLNP